MGRHYKELDSLRGIAAIIVVIAHFITVFPIVSRMIMDGKYGIYFRFFWSGHSSVILFFVLSGFVLSLSFYNSQKQVYSQYLIKRIFRIYFPYIIMIMVTVAVKYVLADKIGKIPGMVPWGQWGHASPYTFLNHVLLLGEYDVVPYMLVVWSLIHEMRISIVFPFLMMGIRRWSWRVSMGIALTLSTSGYVLMKYVPTKFDMPVSTNYFITLHYMAMFIMGALLAKHLTSIKMLVNRFKLQSLILPIGFLFFVYPRIPFTLQSKLTGEIDFKLYLVCIDWYITIGAMLLIVAALTTNIFAKVLVLRPIHFLGQISYSVYLLHVVILLTAIYSLYGKIPFLFILILSFVTTIVVSYGYYRWVEQPFIQWGRNITRKKMKQNVKKEAS